MIQPVTITADEVQSIHHSQNDDSSIKEKNASLRRHLPL